MKVGVFGSGMVGQAIGGKAAELGHEVMVGTRNPAKLQEWLGKVGGGARVGSLAETAAHGELLFNATNLFISGNDADGKIQVVNLLTTWFGWKHIIDLGDITTARGTEMYLPIWLRLWGLWERGCSM